MVYCGKPSKSCAPCRAKRTKCDLKEPSCSQCLRTHRVCTGYRLQEGYEFRDQSNDVTTKQIARNERRFQSFMSSPKASSGSSVIKPVDEMCFNDLGSKMERMSIPPLPTVYPKDPAVCFFFNDYVLDDPMSPRTLYDDMPKMYNDAPEGSVISATIAALGLACLSNNMRLPQVMVKANMEYAKALGMINSALRDPLRAKEDETLMIVMLLGMYEENNPTSKTVDPWTNHVKGALALLDYRGVEQLERQESLALITLLRFQVLVNCLIRRVEVPTSMRKWSRLSSTYAVYPAQLSECELSEIMADFCNLQVDIESTIEKPTQGEIVARALLIESQLMDWSTKWQVKLPFTTVTIDKISLDVYTDHWHIYPGILAASLWNFYRSIRINVNQILINFLSLMLRDSPTHHLVQDPVAVQHRLVFLKSNISELSMSICASVPYYMDRSPLENTLDVVYGPQHTAKVKLLVWPLYVAGSNDHVSDILRLWTAGQLEKSADSMGIWKARALAQLIRAKQRTTATAWRDLGMIVDD